MIFPSFLPRALIIAAITFICYSYMLGSPFKTLDDEFSVVNNKLIQDPDHFVEIFTTGYFQDRTYYRPLTNVSYWVEYHFHKLHTLGFNIDNVMIHIINAVLVFALVYFVGRSLDVGFWVGLLFAIHPVQWESVANISGRAILLSTLFSLISLVTCWLSLHRRWALGWLYVSLISFAAALLSKESGASVVVLIAGIAVLAGKFKREWIMLLPYGSIIAVYALTRHMLGLTEIFQTDRFDIWVLGGASFFYALIDLCRLYILPTDMHFDRSSDFLRSFYDARVYIAFAFWLIAAAVLFFRRKHLTLQGWFWIVLIVVSLLPVSQLVASIGVQPGRISAAEHFLYFASIGVLWWLVRGWAALVAVIHTKRVLLMKILTALFLLFLTLVTIEQNMYANSEFAMINRSLAIDPNNARLQYSLGIIYVLAHNFSQAEYRFRQAVLLEPHNVRYRISWGKSFCDMGNFKECVAIYDGIANPAQFKDLLAQNRKAAVKLHNDQLYQK